MNLGFDFGSTYSMLSYYDKLSKILKAIEIEGCGRHTPSVACRQNSKSTNILIGHTAKQHLVSRTKLTPYRAFKMLLPVDDSEKTAELGYDNEITPRFITKEFIKQQLQTAKTNLHVKQFDKVTICVPQEWDNRFSTISGKGILMEICQELIREENLMDSVRIISEPAAATACFAHNYHTNTGKFYDGWILIVDYGGGTLDITLSQVNTITRRDGTSAMEITVKGEAGVGEHHSKKNIGDAGISYMNGVIQYVLEQQGIHDAPRDREFQNAVDLLESTLINNPQELLDKVLIEYPDNPDLLRYDEDVFTEFEYGDFEDLPITYAALAKVYDDMIRPVLDKELESIFGEMKKLLGINSPRDIPRDKLKIALVGGFGQYIFVQQQVHDFFAITDPDTDPRLQGLEMHINSVESSSADSGKEDAISYGAALIADDVVSLRKSTPLSIGLFSEDSDTHEPDFELAFLAKQLLEPGDVHYLSARIVYLGAESNPEKFPWKLAMNMDGDPNHAYMMIPREHVRKKLLSLPPGPYRFGFSIDESEIISFHNVPEINGVLDRSKAEVTVFGNYADIFGSVLQMDNAKHITKKKR